MTKEDLDAVRKIVREELERMGLEEPLSKVKMVACLCNSANDFCAFCSPFSETLSGR